jgi:acyl carrier protein
MKEVTVEKVLSVINSLDNIEVSTEQLDESLPGLGMDSISFIQIVVGLEEAFDCEIPDSKLLVSEMDTVRKIFDLLQELYTA